MTRFVGCDLRCRAQAHAGEVIGFVADPCDWVLRYVEVRLVGDAPGTIRLLPCAAFPPVVRLDEAISACLTADELGRGQPLVGPCESLTLAEERALHDRLHWRPYWTHPPDDDGRALHDAARAIGASLSCAGEPFGHVDDLIVDTSDWTLPALSIATGEESPGPGLHLPVSFIRSADWEHRRFDSDVRAAALACAPQAEPVLAEADYLDRIRRHLSSG